MTDGFLLDMDSNPHPRMLDAAIRHRRLAHMAGSQPNPKIIPEKAARP